MADLQTANAAEHAGHKHLLHDDHDVVAMEDAIESSKVRICDVTSALACVCVGEVEAGEGEDRAWGKKSS